MQETSEKHRISKNIGRRTTSEKNHGFPVIDNFYSDSLADTPIALCAEKAHFVTNKAQTVSDWPHLDPETMKEVRRKINTGWTIHI